MSHFSRQDQHSHGYENSSPPATEPIIKMPNALREESARRLYVITQSRIEIKLQMNNKK